MKPRNPLTFALLLLCVLCLSAVSARATEITVGSSTFGDYHYAGASARLRIYAAETFTASDGVTVIAGGQVGSTIGFHKVVNCTVASNVLSCPSFTLQSTSDSIDFPTTTYTFVLFDAAGTKRDFFPISEAAVPHTLGATVTVAQLRTYNMARPIQPPPGYYTREQIDSLIASMVGINANASDSVKGITRLSVAPALSTAPIAVGSNDPRMTDVSNATALDTASAIVKRDGSNTFAVSGITNTSNLFFNPTGSLTLKTNGTARQTFLANGSIAFAFPFEKSTITLSSAASQTFTQVNGAFPSFGTAVNYDAWAGSWNETTITANAAQFAAVDRVWAGATAGSLPAGHQSAYGVARLMEARHVPGTTSTLPLTSVNGVCETGTGHSGGCITAEFDYNRNFGGVALSDTYSVFESGIGQAAITLVNGGTDGGYVGLDMKGTLSANRMKRGLVIRDNYYSYGGIVVSAGAVQLPEALFGGKVRNLKTGIALQRSTDSSPSEAENFLLFFDAAQVVPQFYVTGLGTAVSNTKFLTIDGEGFQLWKDGSPGASSPSTAWNMGNKVPGSATETNVFNFSYFNGSGWAAKLSYDGATNAFTVGGSLQVQDAGTKPTCNVTNRFRIWTDAGGAGVADTTEICKKDAADSYSWVAL